MLNSIKISNVATFVGAEQTLDNLSKINFIFGCNGSGKTTISRIIANDKDYPSCSLTWKSGVPLRPFVYNRDFVERNFNQSTELKGVFTLGEGNIDAKAAVTKAKAELGDLIRKIANLKLQIKSEDEKTGKSVELAELEQQFKKICWEQKKKHDAKLQGALEGYRGNAEKFKDKVLQEEKINASNLLSLADLEKKAETVFGETPTREEPLSPINVEVLQSYEQNPILNKRVIGKADVDIATMIKKLGNSDWVREGRSFFDANDNACPFCQQKTNDAFSKSLNEYFDEAFETDSKAISELIANYKTTADRLLQQLSDIIAVPSKFLDVEKLKVEKELLNSKVMVNFHRLEEKKKEPSNVVELESISNVGTSIKMVISAAEAQIAEHNRLVENIYNERTLLTSQVWKFLLEELKIDLADYIQKRDTLVRTIKSINDTITTAEQDKRQKEQDIRNLEKQITSIQPTIDGVNGLLRSFGFHSFSLQIAEDGNSYELLRSDGTNAKETLSEGEKSFVTFLYFYYLLQGSNSSDGITTDRIAVFDDPVSSLDSDILFIVSSLIKRVCEDVKNNQGNIKQIFVLTHNVYFHKEVTFSARRSNKNSFKNETFWIVKKLDTTSEVTGFSANPISTSYELLWADVKNADRSKSTIANTLRRILEHYFKILGGVDPDEVCEKFQGNDKIVCKSLFSWVNAGSHGISDDLYISDNGILGEVYLRVFKEIFEKQNQSAHYTMMMGEQIETDSQGQVNAPASQLAKVA